MTPAFWNSWQLWEKLCFVLACAIIVTIFAGCFRLVQSHRELRKHTALAEKAREGQQVQQVAGTMGNKPGGVPFGVRAIESGIEVDGVWISRSNTPASSNPPSPATLAIDDPIFSKAQRDENGLPMAVPILVMPQPMHAYQGHVGGSARSSSHSPENQAAAAGSPDRFNHLPNSSEDSIKIQIRPTYQPRHSSHLRFSSGDALDLGSPDVEDLAVQAAIGLSPIDKHRTNRFSRSSLDSGSTNGHYIPQRPDHVSTFFSISYPADQGSVDDLPYTGRIGGVSDAFAIPRQYPAAEMGQLWPRGRLSSRNSADWSSVYSQPSERGLPIEQEAPRLPFIPQSHSPAGFSGAATQLEEPPSFQNLLDAHPLNTKRQSIALLGNGEDLKADEKVQSLRSTDASRQLRLPNPARKVNSGFEILPAGTFARRPSSDAAEIRPVSDGSSKRSATKLHKKNRSESVPGRNSTFIETV